MSSREDEDAFELVISAGVECYYEEYPTHADGLGGDDLRVVIRKIFARMLLAQSELLSEEPPPRAEGF